MNEVRFSLVKVQQQMQNGYKPTYIVTAMRLPSGAIELITNTTYIDLKVDYLLAAYDDDMRLHANKEIVLVALLIV